MLVREAIAQFVDVYAGKRVVQDVLMKHRGISDICDIVLLSDSPLVLAELDAIKDMSILIDAGMPLAYVLGYELFCGEIFVVNEDVLIPRAETEYLVQQVVQNMKNAVEISDQTRDDEKNQRLLVDVGTGSGCVGISIMKQCGEFFDECVLVDVSEEALAVAEGNVEKVLGSKRKAQDAKQFCQVRCVGSDLLEQREVISNKRYIDELVVVANLPYIPDGYEGVEKDVQKWEPELALYSGEDGLVHYRRLLEQVRSVKSQVGSLCVWIEMMRGQYDVLVEEFRGLGGWVMYETFHENIVIGELQLVMH